MELTVHHRNIGLKNSNDNLNFRMRKYRTEYLEIDLKTTNLQAKLAEQLLVLALKFCEIL